MRFFLLISCNINHVDSKDFLYKVELIPEHRFPLDNLFNPIRMCIHQDYLILYQSNPQSHRSDFFFSAYSLTDEIYKGSFGGKGRGPGEWLFPTIIPSTLHSPYLYLTDDGSSSQTTALIHKMVLDSAIQLRSIGSFEIDKGGHYSMHNILISNDSLLVYDEFASAPILKVQHLDQDIPVKSWIYGANKGDYLSSDYIYQIQFDENRGVHAANDSCIAFLYTYKEQIDFLDWDLKLKKRLNYQKNKPIILSGDDRMDNVWYYNSAFMGQNFLYTFYYGVPYKEYLGKNDMVLEVFDLKGTPVCSYSFSPPKPAIFTVDERTFTLYGYRNDDGIEDSISVYRLPELRDYLYNR